MSQEFRKEVEVRNKNGIHVRPAAELAELASSFDADINLWCKDNPEIIVNAKSVLGVITLQAIQRVVIVESKGSDAEEAVDKIIQYIEELEHTDG